MVKVEGELLGTRQTATSRWCPEDGHTTVVENTAKWRIRATFPDPLIKGRSVSLTIRVSSKRVGHRVVAPNLDIFWRLYEHYTRHLSRNWNMMNMRSDHGAYCAVVDEEVAARNKLVEARNLKVNTAAKKVEKAILTFMKRKWKA